MKKYTIILYFLCLNSVAVFAQQLPRFTQTMLNPMLVNPAMAGVGSYGSPRYVSANLLYRNQWAGIQGAPTTVAATVQGSFSESNSISYQHGAGASVINESIGAWNRMSGSATYAGHKSIGKNGKRMSYLSAGVSLGLVNYHLDLSKVIAGNPADAAAFAMPRGTTYSVDVGLMYHAKSLFIGFSMNQLLGGQISLLNDNKIVSHYQFMIGGLLVRREESPWGFVPSLLVRQAKGGAMQIEFNGLVRYKENFWVGTSYRHKDGLSLLLGGRFNLADDVPLSLSYSYDFASSSNVSAYSNGSHEIMLGFRFRKHNHGKSGYHGDSSTKVKMWN